MGRCHECTSGEYGRKRTEMRSRTSTPGQTQMIQGVCNLQLLTSPLGTGSSAMCRLAAAKDVVLKRQLGMAMNNVKNNAPERLETV